MKLANEAKFLKKTGKYTGANKQLDQFRKKLADCKAKSFTEFKIAFPSADRVGDKDIEVCIDICGNNYRLIVRNYYDLQRTFFKEFLNHKDYDRKYSC